jgi:hypothetical protein
MVVLVDYMVSPGDFRTDKCWSRGHYYPCFNKEYHVQAKTESRSLTKSVYENFVGDGYAWVRLGSSGYNGWDLDTFVNEILPTFTKSFVLITTDGDASVPSDLNPTTVQQLLASPLLSKWMTQNYDGTCTDARVVPFPIGFDLHTFNGAVELVRIYPSRYTLPHTIPKLWSDVHLKNYPNRFNDPRKAWKDFYEEHESTLTEYVGYTKTRITRQEAWDKYKTYYMVLSLPGNGLDCHRTWEALYLGATVVTILPSPNPLFEQLLSKYRVLILQNFTELLSWNVIFTRYQALQSKPIPDMTTFSFL